MAITNPGDWPVDPNTVDGTELAARLNRWFLAGNSTSASATVPPDIKDGGLWSKTVTGGVELMYHFGGVDYPVGDIKGSAWIPRGTAVVGDVAKNFTEANRFVTPAILKAAFDAPNKGVGWQRLPSGVLMQWGSGVSAAGTDKLFTFPVAYTKSCLISVVTENGHGAPGNFGSIGSSSLTNFNLAVWSIIVSPAVKIVESVRWLAIGE